MPLRIGSWWILLISLALTALVSRNRFKFHFAKGLLVVVLAGAAIATAIGLKSFQGCFPSITPDTWTYAASGQYLRDYPRNTWGPLPTIDKFAGYFSDTRFGTSSLLGFLSVMLHIDTARALLPALVIILVNGMIGFCLLTRLMGASKIMAFGSGIFFVLCGWTADAITIGNLDNLLLLSLSAALLGATLSQPSCFGRINN